jgi:hypothetical protein
MQCVLGEWLFGRSIGKLMTGCAVTVIHKPVCTGTPPPDAGEVVAEPAAEKPVLWRCIVRNLIKWALPVLGLLVLFDAGRRHPGDLAAGTLVVTRGGEPPAP